MLNHWTVAERLRSELKPRLVLPFTFSLHYFREALSRRGRHRTLLTFLFKYDLLKIELADDSFLRMLCVRKERLQVLTFF